MNQILLLTLEIAAHKAKLDVLKRQPVKTEVIRDQIEILKAYIAIDTATLRRIEKEG